jgi:hypothetical protein
MKVIRLGFVLFLAATVAAGTVDFTADVVKTEGEDHVVKGTLHMKGGVYRLEFPDPAGPTIISISDPAKDVVRVLVPRYKMYMEDKYSSRLSRSNDPFAILSVLGEHHEKTDAGTETISGYECAKASYGRGEQVAATVWTSAKLGFPMKISLQTVREVVLSNVKEGNVEAATMEVPEGYTLSDRKTIQDRLMADPELKAKREAWRASQPRRGALTKPLTAGAELRILVGGATRVKAGLAYKAPECKWTLEAFRSGKLLGEKAAAPMVGRVDPVVWEGEGKVPDLVVVKCLEGRAFFSLDTKGKEPLVFATKTKVPVKAGANRNWSVSPKVTLVRIRVTADGGEKNEVAGKVGWVGADGSPENVDFTVAAGETKTFEAGAKAVAGGASYDISRGTGTLEVVEDYRDEKDRKPF